MIQYFQNARLIWRNLLNQKIMIAYLNGKETKCKLNVISKFKFVIDVDISEVVENCINVITISGGIVPNNFTITATFGGKEVKNSYTYYHIPLEFYLERCLRNFWKEHRWK